MKKSLLYLFTVLCVLSLFSSCKDDEKPEVPPTPADVLAEYTADKLKAKIDGQDAAADAKINIEEDADKSLTIKLFNIVPGIKEFAIPKATFEAVTKSAYLSKLSGEASSDLAGYKVAVEGVVEEGVLTANVTLTVIEGDTINTKPLQGKVYKGKMNIEVANLGAPVTVEQRVYVDAAFHFNNAGPDAKRDTAMVKLTIKNFSFEGLNLGNIAVDTMLIQKRGEVYSFNVQKRTLKIAIGEVLANIEGTIVGETLNLKLDIDASGLKVGVGFEGNIVEESKDAKITEMKIESSAIIAQTSKGTTLTLQYWDNAPVEQLLLTPVYKLTDKATVDSIVMFIGKKSFKTYSVKDAIDFSLLKENSADYVKYFLAAEDPNTKSNFIIHVDVLKTIETKYTFDDWKSNDQEGFAKYEEPNGWATSNAAATMLKAFSASEDPDAPIYYPLEAPFPVYKSAAGIAAVRTEYTLGADMYFAVVPAITAGTLFLGEFEISMTDVLESTRFGVPYAKEPVAFTGTYKYTPGTTFYETIVTGTKPGERVVKGVTVPGKTDECTINAILYEVGSYSETLNGTNINSSAKIVAVALLADGTEKADWTNFSINFNYLKSYDATKKYKLAIVCSSSKEGDFYKGAPGSTLLIDKLEVTTK